MRRSEVNALLHSAMAMMDRHGFQLPPWARWSPQQWRENPDRARRCVARQIGWDVTDFGSGRFAERGLLLLCLRNGRPGAPGERPYAEKIMVVNPGQETPWHCHRIKMEDIIVRGGGNLVIELAYAADGALLDDGPIEVVIDEATTRAAVATPLVLRPGSSITLPQGLMHRFYEAADTGPVMVGEVSVVNDDLTDNDFLGGLGRFSAIEEDEPIRYPLWQDLKIERTS